MIKNLRRSVATFLSIVLIAAVISPTDAQAQRAEDISLDAYSYAYGGQLGLVLLDEILNGGVDVAELPGTDQEWTEGDPNPQIPADQELDVAVLNNLINLNLGSPDLPLLGSEGLLEFVLNDANLGAVHEYANAKNPNEAYGAVGLVSGTPATVDLSKGDAGDPYAKVDLISLLGLRETPGFTDAIIDEASLQLGVLGAKAERPNTDADGPTASCVDTALNRVRYENLNHSNLNDQYFIIDDDLDDTGEDNYKFCSGYRIADATLVIDSPLVENIVGEVKTLIENLIGDLNDTLGESGTVNTLLSDVRDTLQDVLDLLFVLTPWLKPNLDDILGLTVTATIDPSLADPVFGTIEDQSGLVKIDLDKGQILVDLQMLHNGDLSNLNPNTPLITEEEITDIGETVTSLLTAPKGGANGNPNGLIARVDEILRGEEINGVQQGGLYGTKLSINLTLAPPVGGTITITSTLRALLSGQKTSNPDQQINFPNEYYYVYIGGGLLSGVLGSALQLLLGDVVDGLVSSVGSLVDGLIFNEGGLLDDLLGGIEDLGLLEDVLLILQPALISLVQPLANAIVNRQNVQKLPQGNLFTVSALELNVLSLGNDPQSPEEQKSLLRLPIATAAVMAQQWDLIELDLNVAQIGNARGLHTDGYNYDLVCAADRWTGINQTGNDSLSYPDTKVGSGFSKITTVAPLSLDDATGGLTDPIEVLPGSVCTITTRDISEEKHAGLRPTGSAFSRTPYTFFLDAEGETVYVSGITPTDDPTEWGTNGVSLGGTNGTSVIVDAETVDDNWKNHSLSFLIPADATSHTVNIVHAYDIDTRDIQVTKNAEGDVAPNATFKFQYSLNGVDNWLPTPEYEVSSGNYFTIEDVPLLNPDNLEPQEVWVREAVTDEADGGPSVSWILDGGTPAIGGFVGGFNTYSFDAITGIDENTGATNPLYLTAKNSYPIEINFEAMLPATGRTTLVWVIGLGLLAALGALILYVRSRKQ